MAEGTVPMLRRDGIEVVSFGPSLHDDDHAYLIRFFESVEQRADQLARFYGSEEWRTSFDERVMSLIETYHVVVVAASPEVAGRVRQGGVTPQRHPDHQLAATSSPLTSSAASPSITSSRAFASDSAPM